MSGGEDNITVVDNHPLVNYLTTPSTDEIISGAVEENIDEKVVVVPPWTKDQYYNDDQEGQQCGRLDNTLIDETMSRDESEMREMTLR